MCPGLFPHGADAAPVSVPAALSSPQPDPPGSKRSDREHDHNCEENDGGCDRQGGHDSERRRLIVVCHGPLSTQKGAGRKPGSSLRRETVTETSPSGRFVMASVTWRQADRDREGEAAAPCAPVPSRVTTDPGGG